MKIPGRMDHFVCVERYTWRNTTFSLVVAAIATGGRLESLRTARMTVKQERI